MYTDGHKISGKITKYAKSVCGWLLECDLASFELLVELFDDNIISCSVVISWLN